MFESMAAFPHTLIGILLAVVLATVIHELGHLLTAYIMRTPIRLVAFGIGRTLWSRTVGELRFELRLLPVGMSVGILGMRDSEGRERYGPGRAAAVAAGGPLAGLVLAFVLVALSGQVAAGSVLREWLITTAGLSTILTLLNLIPLPGLDGGHLLLRLIDMLGLRLAARREAALHSAGLRLLGSIAVGSLLLQLIGVA